MNIKLDCPYARHGDMMRVYCGRQDGEICPFQYFKSCKGWWVNSPASKACKIRTAEKGEEK